MNYTDLKQKKQKTLPFAFEQVKINDLSLQACSWPDQE
jgi:hypothetical protein